MALQLHHQHSAVINAMASANGGVLLMTRASWLSVEAAASVRSSGADQQQLSSLCSSFCATPPRTSQSDLSTSSISFIKAERAPPISCAFPLEAAERRQATLFSDATRFDFKSYMWAKQQCVNRALERALSNASENRQLIPSAAYGKSSRALHDSMRYSLLAGGKRVRPILCLAACELVGGHEDAAMACACAMEMIHTLSLVHDDLPCMDNDDMRRGRSATHKRFGEDVAVRTGVALFGLAVEQIVRSGSERGVSPQRVVRVLEEVTRSVGSRGMVGGQIVDLDYSEGSGSGAQLDLDVLTYIHTHKTAVLLECAVVAGAIVGGASDKDIEALRRYAETTGLLFQVVDDILDVTQCSAQLGKTAGKDLRSSKATFPKLMGLQQARLYADTLNRNARLELSRFDAGKAAPLLALADYVSCRQN
ncbi:hypothetical protein L7F22_017247 [Adiantum nelumboides]|nr:hypothetical protein [Adiantum nelumboides]